MWTHDPDAIALLDTRGTPFGVRPFRQAVTATLPNWTDASFGARHADNTLAALPLLQHEHVGQSMPPDGYGAIVSTRPLQQHETAAFLDAMWQERQLDSITLWQLDQTHGSLGRAYATASIIPINPGQAPASRYTRLAHRSLRRARTAGATVTTGTTDEFWATYENAARQWGGTWYPQALIRRLVAIGTARVHTVHVNGTILAVLLTLTAGSHWMCWLAGQTNGGRRIAASYLAYDAVLAEAAATGIRMVNLGASAGNGAQFKHHLGATKATMREWVRSAQ